MTRASISLSARTVTADAAPASRPQQFQADRAILVEVQRAADNASAVAVDVLAMLGAMGLDEVDEVTSPGHGLVELSRAASADEESTAPDALAALSLHELLTL
jgi:hypothetical protein